MACARGMAASMVSIRDALLRQYPKAKRLDVGDATVIPGLIDAHGHMLGLGMAHLTADLVGTKSKQEIVKRLQAFAATLPADAWLIGYHHRRRNHGDFMRGRTPRQVLAQHRAKRAS